MQGDFNSSCFLFPEKTGTCRVLSFFFVRLRIVVLVGLSCNIRNAPPSFPPIRSNRSPSGECRCGSLFFASIILCNICNANSTKGRTSAPPLNVRSDLPMFIPTFRIRNEITILIVVFVWRCRCSFRYSAFPVGVKTDRPATIRTSGNEKYRSVAFYLSAKPLRSENIRKK